MPRTKEDVRSRPNGPAGAVHTAASPSLAMKSQDAGQAAARGAT